MGVSVERGLGFDLVSCIQYRDSLGALHFLLVTFTEYGLSSCSKVSPLQVGEDFLVHVYPICVYSPSPKRSMDSLVSGRWLPAIYYFYFSSFSTYV